MKPSKSTRKSNKGNHSHRADAEMAATIDELNEFEEFRQNILPRLRAGIKAGKKAPELFAMVEAEAAARAITIGLTTKDEGKALSAITDILNRVHGKAKESVEVTSRLEKLSDSELDSLLESEEEAVKELEH